MSTGVGDNKNLGTGARQQDVLTHCLLGAFTCSHPQANALWALDALTSKQGFKKLASLTTNARARSFLESTRLSEELKASTASRLRVAFALTDKLEQMLSSKHCVQPAKLLSPGKMTLINLGQPPGGMTALTEFWSNLLARMVIDCLMERSSPWSGHHARVVIDEAQVVAEVLNDSAERVLTTGRSKSVSLLALTQGTALLNDASDTLLQVLFTNANTKIIGRLNALDSELLAKQLAPGKGIDETLNEVRARFISQAVNLEDREFFLLQPGERLRFTSAPVNMSAWEEAENKQAKTIETMKTRLAAPLSKKRLTLDDIAPPIQKNYKPKKALSKTAKPRSQWG